MHFHRIVLNVMNKSLMISHGTWERQRGWSNETDEESNRQPSQSARKISPAHGTPGKHVMKFLLQSGKPAQECDYASSCLTAPVLYLSHKHSPRCEYKRTGWGDAFSRAIKRPCASAYKTIGQIRLYRYPLRRRDGVGKGLVVGLIHR